MSPIISLGAASTMAFFDCVIDRSFACDRGFLGHRLTRIGGLYEVPFHRVMLNGEPLATSFVSKDELKAVIPPEAIPAAGTYIVTLKCDGEDFPESHRAHLVVGFKP